MTALRSLLLICCAFDALVYGVSEFAQVWLVRRRADIVT